MDDIKQLFKRRDEAIQNKDRAAFLSTQIDEIANSSVDGYLLLQKLESEVLSIYPEDDKDELSRKVFVVETYYDGDKGTRQGFLIYYLINTKQGWKIYKVSY